MQVLFLGYKYSFSLAKWIKQFGNEVVFTDKMVDLNFIEKSKPEIIISYNYHYIIHNAILDKYKNKIINLHISLLPWNRGVDPNIWSVIDNTPKGVSIHYIDEGIDSGDIILQSESFVSENETLSSSYERLHQEIQELFKSNWESLSRFQCEAKPQTEEGSIHFLKDRIRFNWIIKKYGYSIRIKDFLNLLENSNAE